ncbi:MAG: M1 family aminopeptidase, partial [Acidobacteriota bacterium]
YQLLASGRFLAEERRGDRRWQKRRLEQAGLGVSFALGKFKVVELDVDGLDVTLAIDDNLIAARRWDWEEIDDAVVSATRYFTEIFGPLERQHLTLVTVPSYLSQSLPGFVHLSNLVLAAPRSFSTYNDARLLIAHEIAHQWWGNAIGWKTYRDQWITEAMADYSALLWARNGADPEMRLPSQPKNDWQRLLVQKLRDGRPVEAVGPLVLGQRLQSSLSPNAYSSIVYSKGAVVIDMLSCFWTEETFVEILGHFVRAANGHMLSTEDFFDVLERLTGASLQPFANRFVYATGLPEIYYDYEFESLDDGRTRVQIEAEQELPYRLQHAIVESPWGLDVRSTAVQQLDDQVIPLVVPFQIRLASEGPADERVRTLNGRIQLTEQRTELTFEIEPSPERLRLDEDGQVFGRFFNQQVSPKRTGFFRATSLLQSGEVDAARDRLVELLDFRTPVPEGRDADRFAEWDRVTDCWIRLRLADLELAAGDLDAAVRHVEVASKLAKRDRSLRSVRQRYEAHMALLQGDVDAAYRQLRRLQRRLGKRAAVPVRMLGALAAWRTGRHDEAREILDALDGTGADVELLRQQLDAAGDS